MFFPRRGERELVAFSRLSFSTEYAVLRDYIARARESALHMAEGAPGTGEATAALGASMALRLLLEAIDGARDAVEKEKSKGR